MRIAQVAPLIESVPPKYYGGTERVVSYLTEELVRQGHEVTLFASGDSVTKARLLATSRRSLRLDRTCVDRLAHQICQLEDVYRHAGRFEIIHFHTDYPHFPVSSRQPVPHVTTLHSRLDVPDLVPVYRRFQRTPVVSISDAQRAPLPWLNWQGTVYHGLPEDAYTFQPDPGKHLAFIGRISPEKRVDRAIEIARRVGMEIKIAAKVDDVDREYFETYIAPLLKDRYTDYVGEIGEGEKDDLLGSAAALLFPIDWPEPFGLVMIEAMACGTPIVAYRQGSVPEVIDEGVTGFIVEGIGDAVKAVERVFTLSRKRCRERFQERFTVSRMARDYREIYERLIEDGHAVGPRCVVRHRNVAKNVAVSHRNPPLSGPHVA